MNTYIWTYQTDSIVCVRMCAIIKACPTIQTFTVYDAGADFSLSVGPVCMVELKSWVRLERGNVRRNVLCVEMSVRM